MDAGLVRALKVLGVKAVKAQDLRDDMCSRSGDWYSLREPYNTVLLCVGDTVGLSGRSSKITVIDRATNTFKCSP